MPARVEIINQTFGKLTVIAEAPSIREKNGRTNRMSLCKCACGKEVTIRNGHLTTGHATSCGCGRLEATTQHGHARRDGAGIKSRTYICWANMIDRCNNPNSGNYKNYGARGIGVCKQWEDFEVFLRDVGECPPGKSIDRIENNGHYEPGNIKWSTAGEQCQNRRNTIRVTFEGISGSLLLVCRHFGVPYKAAYKRIKAGESPEAVLNRLRAEQPRY